MHPPSKGIMDVLYERKVADRISSQSWSHPIREDFELLEVLSQFDIGNIVHNVQ